MDLLLGSLEEWAPPCGLPVYCSMDLRDSGWKVSAVDVNLFPAGFNNLSLRDRAKASEEFKKFFETKLGNRSVYKIVLLPEAHTNNKGYLENLAGLISLLESAGAEVKLVWSGPPLPKSWKLTSPSGKVLEYLTPADAYKDAHAVLANHDMSGGIPPVLRDVSVPIFPNPRMGWFRRRKSQHQIIVEALLKRLEQRFDFFDPWYFSPKTLKLENLNFDSDADIALVKDQCVQFFNQIQKDYKERGIDSNVSIFLKNDAGTYGMGVLAIDSKETLENIDKELRQKMRKGKEAVPISQVIIQEGIPTGLFYKEGERTIAAEPVLYMVNNQVIGGFLRLHRGLGEKALLGNLNQPGSEFVTLECEQNSGRPPLPFPELRGLYPCQQIGYPHIYHFLGKLHSLAAGLEDCPDL